MVHLKLLSSFQLSCVFRVQYPRRWNSPENFKSLIYLWDSEQSWCNPLPIHQDACAFMMLPHRAQGQGFGGWGKQRSTMMYVSDVTTNSFVIIPWLKPSATIISFAYHSVPLLSQVYMVISFYDYYKDHHCFIRASVITVIIIIIIIVISFSYHDICSFTPLFQTSLLTTFTTIDTLFITAAITSMTVCPNITKISYLQKT